MVGPGDGTGQWRLLVVAGTLELGLLSLLAWWPDPALPLPGLGFFFAAFFAYAGAAVGSGNGTGSPAVIWIFAVLFRLALLPAAPELSDDVYRYLWDGHVQLQGVNPFRYAPGDPELFDLRTFWHDRINHPDVPTIYPPLAQAAFLLIAVVGGGVVQAKLLWVGLDLLTGWVLGRVARATGRAPGPVLILYLWCPLLVVETAWSGHLEPLGLLAVALLLLPRAGSATAGVAGAAAALVRLAPLAALPPLLRHFGRRFAFAFSLTLLILYLPYLGAGTDLWVGLFTYVRDWRFMVGPFGLIEWVLPGRWPPRIAAGAVIGGVVAWTTLRSFDPERALFWILGAGLLLSPTVHPWYVLWILPFAALRRSGPWILLCGLVFLGYWGLGPYTRTGVWPQPLWLRMLVWTPPLAWLALEAIRGSRLPPAQQVVDPQTEVPRREEQDERDRRE